VISICRGGDTILVYILLSGVTVAGGLYLAMLFQCTNQDIVLASSAQKALDQHESESLSKRLSNSQWDVQLNAFVLRQKRRRLRRLKQRIDLKQAVGPVPLIGFHLMQYIRLDARNRLYYRVWQQTEYIYGSEQSTTICQYLWALGLSRASLGLISGSSIAIMAYAIDQNSKAILIGMGLSAIAFVFGYLAIDPVLELARKRRQGLKQDFPHAITKFALLLGAGVELNSAWQLTASSSHGLFYTEMQNVCAELENGVRFSEAYASFSKRCQIQEVAKLGAIIEQANRQGQSLLVGQLQDIVKEVWVNRQHQVKRMAEIANSKLLGPLLISLIGVMLLVLGPVLIRFK